MDTPTSEAVRTFPRRHALSRRFTLGAPRSWTVSTDGDRVLFLRSAGPTDTENSLWVIDRGDDEPRCLFDASGGVSADLSAAERARRERAREQAGGVVTYAARADCTEVVFAQGAAIHRIAVDGARNTLAATEPFDPRLQPDGDLIAYVSGRGLRVVDGDGDGDRAIPGTLDAEETVSWGSAEFVAAEEMGRSRGFWWAPTGTILAAVRVDTAAVDEWWIAAPDAPWQAPRAIRYPPAGGVNADVELWIVDPETGPVRSIEWARDEFEYLADVRWGDRLLVTVQTRDQRTTAILEVGTDGTVREVQRIVDEHWTELFPNTPLPTEHGLATIVDADRRSLALDGRVLPAGDRQIRQLLGAGNDGLVAIATTDGTDAQLIRVGPDGTVEELGPSGGQVNAVWSGGTTCVTSVDESGPPSHRIAWNDGSVCSIESFAERPGFPIRPAFEVLGHRALNAALLLPDGHDGSPLPVLLDPYGGPHAQRVVRSSGAFATSQWFAEQGFAVVVVDGRGTPGRGPAFERAVWGDLASPVLEDQVDALTALAATRDEVDLGRVGIRGWSFGGYLAALAVLRRPDVFHAAVAGAPVVDWKLYDTHYTERYLGHPEHHPEHYEATNLLTDASRLERPLMLIHGLADDNVVAAHTLGLSSALLASGRDHTVLPLSGVTHMTPQEQVAENLLHLQRDFLHRHLTAV